MKYLVWLVCLFAAQAMATSSPIPLKHARSLMDNEVIYLLVDKSNLRAELRTWPQDQDNSELLLTLRIAVGKAPGDKQVEGDNKTPEGIYFTQNLIDGNTLPAKYGPFAIPINFPNTFDRKQGKTGYGIWLHGVERDARIEEANVTEGCVAFYNADIVALAKWLEPQQTIVVIADRGDTVNQTVDVGAVVTQTKLWQHSWQERNLPKYARKYSSEFKFRGMNLRGFTKYKRRVFSSYDKMSVNFTNTRVFTHDKYAISIMNQDFNGDNRYISKGRKILYWTKQGGSWKIVHEIFESKSFDTQPFSRELFAKLNQQSPSSKQFTKYSKESKL